jgi:SAM-dependent methyltransferase
MKPTGQIWDELPLKSDKGDIHSYLPVYEILFKEYRQTAKNILEIGIFKGHSLLMWEQYFTGKVYGVDCDVKPHGGMADLTEMIEAGKHNILIFNAEDPNEVEKYFKNIKFDLIIEDAGHHVEQQLNLYSIWKDYLADGGIYIIEDVQDLDNSRFLFEDLAQIGTCVAIVDRREVKGRYDDVLIVIK